MSTPVTGLLNFSTQDRRVVGGPPRGSTQNVRVTVDGSELTRGKRGEVDGRREVERGLGPTDWTPTGYRTLGNGTPKTNRSRLPS